MTRYIKPRKLVNIRTDMEPHFKKEHVADKKGAPHSFFGRKPPTTSLAYEDLAEGKTGEDVKGKKPTEDDKKAYIELLQEAINRNIPLKGVYLYGVERPSLLPESANKISKLPEDWLISFAEQIRNIGISVKVSA